MQGWFCILLSIWIYRSCFCLLSAQYFSFMILIAYNLLVFTYLALYTSLQEPNPIFYRRTYFGITFQLIQYQILIITMPHRIIKYFSLIYKSVMSFKIVWLEDKQFRIQQYPTRAAAYQKYEEISKHKCIIQSGLIIQSLAGKHCVGYAISQSLIPFYSKDYRIIYQKDEQIKTLKDIKLESQAIFAYQSLGENSKCLVKQNKILKREGSGLNKYLPLAELIYVKEEEKKFGFQIIKSDKSNILELEGKCKMCKIQKANVVHISCSHLVYCEKCDKNKLNQKCQVCGVQSNTIVVAL